MSGGLRALLPGAGRNGNGAGGEGAATPAALLDLVLERDDLAELDAAERRLAIRAIVSEAIGAHQGAAQLGARVDELADAIDGFGPLSSLMRAEGVTDVMVNGPDEVWIERDGHLERTGVHFHGEEQLRALIERLLGEAGARVDVSSPLADARLADGTRIHVALPPIAPHGPLMSLRRFPSSPLSLDDLVARGMMQPPCAERLSALVEERKSVAISGGTGTGKTTLLNALLQRIRPAQRVIVIEEIPELSVDGRHAVSLVARPPNVEGRGAVDLAALVRAALRMRPDRIVIGEVRGAEALAALAAMSTGHEGSMVTVHARSAEDAVDRLVSLALLASSGVSELSLERQFRRAFDAIVHLSRAEDGSRRVASLMEVS